MSRPHQHQHQHQPEVRPLTDDPGVTVTATIAETMPTGRADQHRAPRRVPRPLAEPPYDSERRPAGRRPSPTQGALALDLRPSRELPTAEPTAADQSRHLRLVDGTFDDDVDRFFERQPTPRAQLPNPKPFCARYVQALVEVMAGGRPVNQLMRWTSDEIYADLRHRVRMLKHAARRGSGQIARAVIRSVHVQEPDDGIAEACVHVTFAGQSRAVALRIEGLDGHWRCTALQLG